MCVVGAVLPARRPVTRLCKGEIISGSSGWYLMYLGPGVPARLSLAQAGLGAPPAPGLPPAPGGTGVGWAVGPGWAGVGGGRPKCCPVPHCCCRGADPCQVRVAVRKGSCKLCWEEARNGSSHSLTEKWKGAGFSLTSCKGLNEDLELENKNRERLKGSVAAVFS